MKKFIVKAKAWLTESLAGVRLNLGDTMRNLLILVKMQLKEKLNFKRRELKDTTLFHVLLSVVVAVLKFALVTVLCGAFLFVAQLLNLFAIKSVPPSAISLFFSVMLVMSVISCTVGLTKAMYYSRDNAVLLTLPATPTQVYLSKLIIFFTFELKRNLSFIVPLFISYFILHSYSFIYYPWLLVCFVFISLFTVSVGALLSIPAMWICNFFRQSKKLQIGTLAAVVAAAVGALVFAISLIPSNIDILETWDVTTLQIQGLLKSYMSNFSWLYDITLMMLGDTEGFTVSLKFVPTLLRFLQLLGITAVLFTAGMLIVRPIFYSMASKPFEYLKKYTKPKKNRVHTRRKAAVGTEFLIAMKSPERIFSNVGIFIAIPILIYLLNKIFLAMNTREIGDYMVVAFNVLIILLLALNANCYAASIFSRDGRSSYLIKSQPSKYLILILSKLLPNTVFVCASLAVTFGVLLSTASLGFANTLLLMLGLGSIYLAHMLYSAEQDLMNPQIEIYATIGSDDNNPNETKSTVWAFIISFAVAAAVLLLLIENAGPYTYHKLALAGFAAMCYRTWLFFSKIKLYYKEK